MVARRTLLILWILLTWTSGTTLRIQASATPPDHLSPRPITDCFNQNSDPALCLDGNVRELDATVRGDAVSFTSFSNRLVAGDSNEISDVFLWRAGSIQRVSVGAQGEQGDHVSDHAAISGNGRYLYFRSQAGNFAPDTIRTRVNLYLKDLVSGELSLISRDGDGMPINGTNLAEHFTQIDTDFSGRYVVFASSFPGFVEGASDTNLVMDIFLGDVDPDDNGDYFDSAPIFYLLSALPDGITAGNASSFDPTMSQDGTRIAWLTRATNLADGLASNGVVVDVLLAHLGRLSDGSVDPTTRVLYTINRLGDDATVLTPDPARLARVDPWRDQVAFVTATDILGTGDNHAGDDLYLSVGAAGDPNNRHMVWLSHAYSTSAPSALHLAWDPALPAAAWSQAAWVGQQFPRTTDDLLLARSAPFYPVGWSTINWVEAHAPSGAAVTEGTLSADGRFAFWVTQESYGHAVPTDSENLFRRAIAPAQSVTLTVVGEGGGAMYAPTGAWVGGTMLYSPTTVVTLTPQADVGYRFNGWAGVDYRQGMTATVIVYAARTVTATFEAMTPPIASHLAVTVAEEATLPGITLAITDPDPDEQHTVMLAAPPLHGTAAVTNNVISYMPAPNFSGQDAFALQVTDAYGLQLAMPAVVTVTVTPVGDAPMAHDLAVSVAEDEVLVDVAPAISDADVGDSHTVSIVQLPSHGTATLDSNTVSYQPAPNFNGQDGFLLQVEDSFGLTLSAAARVTVTVTPVNDAPTAGDLVFTVTEDTLLEGIALAIADPDADDSHTVSLATSPAQGIVSVSNNLASYQPALNFHGEDTFTLQVMDAEDATLAAPATVTVHVTPVNDAPIFASAQGSGVSTGVVIPVLVKVQDPDAGDSYTLRVEQPPTVGTVKIMTHAQATHFAYVPPRGFEGVEHFIFRATDSSNASITGTATITVTKLVSPPVTPITPIPSVTPVTPVPSVTPEPTTTPTPKAQLRLPTLRRAD